MKVYERAPHTGTMIGDLLSQVDETLARGAEAIPTKVCRICNVPKTIHHFTPSQWNKYTGQGLPVCRSCVKIENETRRGTCDKAASRRWMHSKP
jgi:hypothetical protein